MKIDGLLQLLIDQKGSDLFLSVGIEPCLKVNGKMTPLGSVRLDAEMVTEFIREVMTPAAYERYCQFCHSTSGAGSFPGQLLLADGFPGHGHAADRHRDPDD